MTVSIIKFSAFNINTNSHENFECHMIRGIHSDAKDAANSKLWYGECWSNSQIEAAQIVIESEIVVIE